MEWLARGLAQFQNVPANDKIPVLLSSPDTLQYLADGSFASIPDETVLRSHIDSISSRLGMFKFSRWVGAVTSAMSGPVLTPDGFPGQITFPIFPFKSANNELVRPIQFLERDAINVESFVEYFGLFSNIPSNTKPRVIFSDTKSKVPVGFFSRIHNFVDLYQIYPEGLQSISPPKTENAEERKFDLLSHGADSGFFDQL